MFNYDLPFTIFDRFIPSTPWNMDSKQSPTQNILFTSGERRKKEVKDDFEWLHPTTRPADVTAAREAYTANYNFIDGIQAKDPKVSSAQYCMPVSVSNRCTNFDTYLVPMKHPLCQIEQSIDWLIKPVNNLLDRIKSSDQRTHTRSSLQDVSMGKYIFHRSAYCNATDFVCSSDDVELIDFVENDSTKKIWHCSDLLRSEMLRKAVIAAYTSAVNDEETYRNVPEWLSLIESARSKVGKSCHIKFLGLVSLFESKSGNKIVAF